MGPSRYLQHDTLVGLSVRTLSNRLFPCVPTLRGTRTVLPSERQRTGSSVILNGGKCRSTSRNPLTTNTNVKRRRRVMLLRKTRGTSISTRRWTKDPSRGTVWFQTLFRTSILQSPGDTLTQRGPKEVSGEGKQPPPSVRRTITETCSTGRKREKLSPQTQPTDN